MDERRHDHDPYHDAGPVSSSSVWSDQSNLGFDEAYAAALNGRNKKGVSITRGLSGVPKKSLGAATKSLSRRISELFLGPDPELGRDRHDSVDLLEGEERSDQQKPYGPYNPKPFNAPEYVGTRPIPEETAKIPAKFRRRTRLNFYGLLVNLTFYCALGFYAWVRVTKTLDLGPYLWYGLLVFVVEMMGATTTIIYGLNHVWKPVHEKFTDDPETANKSNHPTLPKVALRYNIRVLIPCYKEDLEILEATINGCRAAWLPRGCTRTIYLCDDGKDLKKLEWCRSAGPDVVYVSGRVRKSGEINGKSGNLNNCLSHIYPVESHAEIPSNEVVCVFDADQVAKENFFVRLLPLFDAGEDVGMVLSPQAFYNTRTGDIFNHGNTHFWEYMQVGYDALGFISCTGTNFMVRAKAFKHTGWSPTYTMTEDYALGMELKKRGWHCRYVNEYLAIGEAPDQIRNCYQQRSRWAKGHFQMFFQWSHCPLTQRGLSPFMRILYCSGVWSYIVTFTTTPLFIILPLITVWIGLFPLQINWWAWLAITVYFVAAQLVMGYVRQLSHVSAIFYADISNRILWFTYLKAFWRGALAGLLGRVITFKATAKGRFASMVESVWIDLLIPFVSFIALFITLIIGAKNLANAPTLETTLTISIVWIVYNLVPPYLIIHYTWLGKSGTLTFACRVCMVLSWICGIAGLLLLWWLIPEEYDIVELTKTGISLLSSLGQLSGAAIPVAAAPAAGRRLLQEGSTALVSFNDGYIQTGPAIKGGWMALDEAGPVQLTVPTAFTTTMLAWGLMTFPRGYAFTKTTDDIVAQIKSGADYLSAAIQSDTHPVPTPPPITPSPTPSPTVKPTKSPTLSPTVKPTQQATPVPTAPPKNPATTPEPPPAKANPPPPPDETEAPADPVATVAPGRRRKMLQSDPVATPPPVETAAPTAEPAATPEATPAATGAPTTEPTPAATTAPDATPSPAITATPTPAPREPPPPPGPSFQLVYQVGNYSAEYLNYNGTVAQLPKDGRPAYTVSTLSGASDLGGHMVAGLAAAALALDKIQPGANTEYAKGLIKKAQELYAVVGSSSNFNGIEGRYGRRIGYSCTPFFARGAGQRDEVCVNQFDGVAGSAAALYNLTTYQDELMWAAAWLYRASRHFGDGADQQNKWKNEVEHHARLYGTEGRLFDRTFDSNKTFDINTMYWPAAVLMAQETQDDRSTNGEADIWRGSAALFLKDWLCGSEVVESTPFGRSWNKRDGRAPTTMNAAWLAMVYGDVLKAIGKGSAGHQYRCYAHTQARQMMGDGAQSLVVGLGRKHDSRIEPKQQRLLCGDQPTCAAASGAIYRMGEKSDKLEYGKPGREKDARIGLEYHAAFQNLLAAIGAIEEKEGITGWGNCLQGQGVVRFRDVCNQNVRLPF